MQSHLPHDRKPRSEAAATSAAQIVFLRCYKAYSLLRNTAAGALRTTVRDARPPFPCSNRKSPRQFSFLIFPRAPSVAKVPVVETPPSQARYKDTRRCLVAHQVRRDQLTSKVPSDGYSQVPWRCRCPGHSRRLVQPFSSLRDRAQLPNDSTQNPERPSRQSALCASCAQRSSPLQLSRRSSSLRPRF